MWTAINFPPIQPMENSDSLGITRFWQRPEPGMVKCNVHANWRNEGSLVGGAWISRDYQGNVLHHARDALISSPNRLAAELRCTIWALQSLKDLGYNNGIIGLDLKTAFQSSSSIPT